MAQIFNNSTAYILRVKGLGDITFLGRVIQKGLLHVPEEGVYEIHVRYGARGLALLQRGLLKKNDQLEFSHEDIEAQVKRTTKYLAKMKEINAEKARAERKKLEEAMELEAVTNKMAPLSIGSGSNSSRSGASTSSAVLPAAPASNRKAAATLYDVDSDDSDLDFDDSDDE